MINFTEEQIMLLQYAALSGTAIETKKGKFWISGLPPFSSEDSSSIVLEEEKKEEFSKQFKYLDQNGSEDLIDRWHREKGIDEFRAIMIAQIEKYCSRYGKKDSCYKEITKIVDYAQRLREVEEGYLPKKD